MDIKVRNLDATIIKRLDQLAKKQGKSREEFLRNQLEIITVIDLIEEHQKKVDAATKVVTDMLIDTSKKLDVMERTFEKLMILISIITEIDLEFIDEFAEVGKRKVKGGE